MKLELYAFFNDFCSHRLTISNIDMYFSEFHVTNQLQQLVFLFCICILLLVIHPAPSSLLLFVDYSNSSDITEAGVGDIIAFFQFWMI